MMQQQTSPPPPLTQPAQLVHAIVPQNHPQPQPPQLQPQPQYHKYHNYPVYRSAVQPSTQHRLETGGGWQNAAPQRSTWYPNSANAHNANNNQADWDAEKDKRYRRRLWWSRCWRTLFLALAALGGAWYCHQQFGHHITAWSGAFSGLQTGDASQGAHLVRMARELNYACMSSLHAKFNGTRIVGFADGTVLYDPLTVDQDPAKKVVEYAAFCPSAPNRTRTRSLRVVVRSRGRTHDVELVGMQAVCYQHCVEVFEANDLCGTEKITEGRKTPANMEEEPRKDSAERLLDASVSATKEVSQEPSQKVSATKTKTKTGSTGKTDRIDL